MYNEKSMCSEERRREGTEQEEKQEEENVQKERKCKGKKRVEKRKYVSDEERGRKGAGSEGKVGGRETK